MPDPPRAPRTGAAVVLLLAGLHAVPVWGQQYNFTRYATSSGLPAARTMAVLQDSRGFLWFGTSGGLARYDGASFQVLTARDGLAGNAIVALGEDDRGSIYAAAGEGGVSIVDPSGAIRRLDGEGTAGIRVVSIERDAEGHLWMAADRRVLEVSPAGDARILRPDGEVPGCCTAAYRDRRGRLWVGTEQGLARERAGVLARDRTGIPGDVAVRALIEDEAGTLWVGTDAGLFRESAGRFRRLDTPLGQRVEVLSAAPGLGGTLWFGTERGALRVLGSSAQAISTANGLPDERVHAVRVDHEGNVWFATDSGAAKLVASNFATYTTAHGLPGDFVVAVAQAGENLWVATRRGIVAVESEGVRASRSIAAPAGASFTSLHAAGDDSLLVGTSRGLFVRRDDDRIRGPLPGIGTRHVTALAVSAAGTWIGTESGLLLGDGRRFEPAPGRPEVTGAHVTALAVDGAGRLWVGTAEAGLFALTRTGFQEATLAEGRRARVWALSTAPDGSVWAGTNGLGAVHFLLSGDAIRLTREGNGLASDFVQQVLPDRAGRLWIYTTRGLDRWDPSVGVTHYDLGAGLADMTGNPGAALEDGAGRVWFGTPSGLTVYRPGPEAATDVPPTVVIRSVRVEGEPATEQDLLRLSSSRNEVTVDFTALSYRDEASTRFQYRLLGRNDTWSRPTAERRVSLIGLPPGDYVFEVQAINGRGLWSASPAALPLRVRPAIWQTGWFQGATLAVVLLLLAALFRRRLRQVEGDRRRLRSMVDKRTRELVEKNTLLERMATTDELTALPNRRFFLESMEREIRKMTRLPTEQPLSLLLLDLDHFKSINDRYGHAAGDEVLRQVSRRLAQGVRATDLPARYGGEEFAILLPNTGPDGAHFLGEKLRGDVESMGVEYEGQRIPITISVGVATATGIERYAPEVEEALLRRADEAMYKAKTGGRNRVEIAD